MPNSTVQRHPVASDKALVEAKRAQYQDILVNLAQLDTNNDASRVLNYNKREALQLLELIRGSELIRGKETPRPGWLNRENIVGTVRATAAGRPCVGARDEAITRLGHLFYLDRRATAMKRQATLDDFFKKRKWKAGAQMTSVLDASLEALLAVLRDLDSTEQRRVLAVKALGEVCWGSVPSQLKLHAQGGVQTLVECVYSYHQLPSLARWACHTLTVLLADSAEIWKYLGRLEALERTLTDLAGEEPLWLHWDNNHAAILHGLLFGSLADSK